jgi:hypothetical protein
MGLAQKRIIQEFQTTEFPAWKKSFDEVVGSEIPMDIKWETMQSDDRNDKDDYFNCYRAVYFNPLMTAFKNICADAMGKEAVAGGVKQIVIDGTEGIYADSSKFEGGTLTIKHIYDSNTHKEDERATVWQNLIEAKL